MSDHDTYTPKGHDAAVHSKAECQWSRDQNKSRELRNMALDGVSGTKWNRYVEL
jgi:hypothetical protein